MRFSEFKLNESAGQNVYHVTFSKHVPAILKGGLRPLQPSNWVKRGDPGTRYNEEGGVFAFADPLDAFKWANMQQYDRKQPVSIVTFKRGDTWEKDPSGDIQLTMGQGDALRSMSAVPASDILNVNAFDDFSDPTQLQIPQAEWFQRSVDMMNGKQPVAETTYGGTSTVSQDKIPKRVHLRPRNKWANDFLSVHGHDQRVAKVLNKNPMTGKTDSNGAWIFVRLNDVNGGRWINVQNDENFIVYKSEDDFTMSNRQVTEAPAKKVAPKKKKPTAAQRKAAHEKIRMSTQSGTIDKKQMWGVKKALASIITKYAVGDDWEVNNQYLDTGLYYNGNDMAEAKRVGDEIIGALYGYFQDGSKKSITKLKREEDANTMQFTAMPMKDQFGQNPPQVSFVLHKNIKPGSPIIGIHLNV